MVALVYVPGRLLFTPLVRLSSHVLPFGPLFIRVWDGVCFRRARTGYNWSCQDSHNVQEYDLIRALKAQTMYSLCDSATISRPRPQGIAAASATRTLALPLLSG